MELKVDRTQAREILEQAYSRVRSGDYTPCSRFAEEIHHVMFGTHLTYKYVMVNGFLAKATNPEVNALCLQKKSELEGAYDARTLCHKVFVPFERERLRGALGNSNEPFLNKPARFPELSTSNAVRRGQDSELLALLCRFLPNITTRSEAFDALSDAIYFALEISRDKEDIAGLEAIKVPSYTDIKNIVDDLLSESHGGESLALAVGALLNLVAMNLPGEARVEVHVVNQSGASSKEISDIDVYLDDEIFNAAEAKDKVFTQEDVEHAVRKVATAGCNRMMFITGPRAHLEGPTEEFLVERASQMGVHLTFMNHMEFTGMVLATILPTSTEEFFSILRDIIYEARMKEGTLNHLLEVARRHQLI